MKKIFLLLLPFAIYSNLIFCQDVSLLSDGKLNIDSFYKDKSVLLIYSEILTIDSINKGELIKNTKNWAGGSFVNLKEILVSETDDQLVLNYINNSYSTNIGWYIRLIFQFKNGKIKISYYDDGNASNSVTRPRTYYFKDFFKEEDGIMTASKRYLDGLLSIHKNILSNSSSIRTYFEKKDSW